MELNIQAIADNKIQSMHDSGEIQRRIEDDVEKMINSAIDSALSGYQLHRDIEDVISKSVSSTVKEIGFSAYNGFIAQTIKNITEGAMRDDVAQKIQKVFNDMMVVKHDGIKLSEIFDKYREWVCENADESEKYERRNFTCDIDSKEDGSFTWYTVKFSDEEKRYGDNQDIEFCILDYQEKMKSKITRLSFNGKSVDGKFTIGSINEIESLLANLYFNETEIELDIDDIDDSNYYDIDD
jgi:hypothetical protein